jgi:hypothetical protein
MKTATLTLAFSALISTTSIAADKNAHALRVREDSARNHVWVLQREAVYLYDAKSRALRGRYELPDWIYVGDRYGCAPDLAVDAAGTAVVSSNIAPVLWRIDAAKHAVTRHELVLDADRDKEVGFSGLAYAPDQGVFFAVSSLHGSLWRIDPLLRRAQKIPLSTQITDACGLGLEQRKTRRTVVLCANGWTVHLTPDQRSGYVQPSSCRPYVTAASR